ncbi:MAG TPA: type II toxin-antitoxin system VapC family toxin [Caulobacterales bacterium]|nr:type II toxin-antitoxin system VapC family toxin [Caulobacterales bacterium]
MSIVIDASVAACWIFENEATPATDALLARVRDSGGIVPVLWNWEMANLLIAGVRRARLSMADAAAFLGDLALLPIVIDTEAPARAWRETFLLAQTHALTAYDAAYLELAQRAGLELASKDGELCAAARSAGVKLAL